MRACLNTLILRLRTLESIEKRPVWDLFSLLWRSYTLNDFKLLSWRIISSNNRFSFYRLTTFLTYLSCLDISLNYILSKLCARTHSLSELSTFRAYFNMKINKLLVLRGETLILAPRARCTGLIFLKGISPEILILKWKSACSSVKIPLNYTLLIT